MPLIISKSFPFICKEAGKKKTCKQYHFARNDQNKVLRAK